MKFLVLGASGMAGHTISIYLKEQGHDVTAFTRRPFLYSKNIIGDVRDIKLLKQVILDGQFDVVINCVGLLNQNAESHKHQAVFLNSYLPHYLSHITDDTNTKIIQMSTDCVFSGETGNYCENSFTDGATFYDRSKALGEINDKKNLTFRNSIIGPDINESGIGLFNWFMKQTDTINGYKGAIWTGVTTLTLAKAMEYASKEGLNGLYNLVNNSSISKFDLCGLFNKYFKDNQIIINPSNQVILNKSLVNTRASEFSFVVPTYDQMVLEMKEWVYSHKELYPHYFR
jgi:dTDP-4-dehydrorhamnose reductase